MLLRRDQGYMVLSLGAMIGGSVSMPFIDRRSDKMLFGIRITK